MNTDFMVYVYSYVVVFSSEYVKYDSVFSLECI